MTIRTPQRGDGPLASEDREIVQYIRDQAARPLPAVGPIPGIMGPFVAEITSVLASGSGAPRYGWKMVYAEDSGSGDLTWGDAYAVGDGESYPYAFEADRATAAADPAGYAVGDRVILTPIQTNQGLTLYAMATGFPRGTATGDMLYWDDAAERWGLVEIGGGGDILIVNGGTGTPYWTDDGYGNSVTVVTAVAEESGTVYYKSRVLDFENGRLTTLHDESAWTEAVARP